MTLEIYVRPKGKGFKAIVKGFAECSVEAPTRDEAVALARHEAEELIENSDVIQVETSFPPRVPHRIPHRGIGMWADDETFDDFVAAMKQYREQVNAESD
jgi:hypothetical protein